MRQIIYMSQSKTRLSDADLTDILRSARRNNEARHVTGILLYAGNTFFQVLEGMQHVVEDIYDMVFFDERHAMVKMLASREIARREFEGWSMGFRRLNEADIAHLGFFDLSKSSLTRNIPQDVSEATVNFLLSFSNSKIQVA